MATASRTQSTKTVKRSEAPNKIKIQMNGSSAKVIHNTDDSDGAGSDNSSPETPKAKGLETTKDDQTKKIKEAPIRVDTSVLENVTCTSCGRQLNPYKNNSVQKHPTLKVIICKKCDKFLDSGQIAKDKDGIDEQCRWCGEGGRLVVCDHCSCAFCKACVMRNFNRSEFNNINDQESWKCYICDNAPLQGLRENYKNVRDAMKALQAKKKRKEQAMLAKEAANANGRSTAGKSQGATTSQISSRKGPQPSKRADGDSGSNYSSGSGCEGVALSIQDLEVDYLHVEVIMDKLSTATNTFKEMLRALRSQFHSTSPRAADEAPPMFSFSLGSSVNVESKKKRCSKALNMGLLTYFQSLRKILHPQNNPIPTLTSKTSTQVSHTVKSVETNTSSSRRRPHISQEDDDNDIHIVEGETSDEEESSIEAKTSSTKRKSFGKKSIDQDNDNTPKTKGVNEKESLKGKLSVSSLFSKPSKSKSASDKNSDSDKSFKECSVIEKEKSKTENETPFSNRVTENITNDKEIDNNDNAKSIDEDSSVSDSAVEETVVEQADDINTDSNVVDENVAAKLDMIQQLAEEMSDSAEDDDEEDSISDKDKDEDVEASEKSNNGNDFKSAINEKSKSAVVDDKIKSTSPHKDAKEKNKDSSAKLKSTTPLKETSKKNDSESVKSKGKRSEKEKCSGDSSAKRDNSDDDAEDDDDDNDNSSSSDPLDSDEDDATKNTRKKSKVSGKDTEKAKGKATDKVKEKLKSTEKETSKNMKNSSNGDITKPKGKVQSKKKDEKSKSNSEDEDEVDKEIEKLSRLPIVQKKKPQTKNDKVEEENEKTKEEEDSKLKPSQSKRATKISKEALDLDDLSSNGEVESEEDEDIDSDLEPVVSFGPVSEDTAAEDNLSAKNQLLEDNVNGEEEDDDEEEEEADESSDEEDDDAKSKKSRPKRKTSKKDDEDKDNEKEDEKDGDGSDSDENIVSKKRIRSKLLDSKLTDSDSDVGASKKKKTKEEDGEEAYEKDNSQSSSGSSLDSDDDDKDESSEEEDDDDDDDDDDEDGPKKKKKRKGKKRRKRKNKKAGSNEEEDEEDEDEEKGKKGKKRKRIKKMSDSSDEGNEDDDDKGGFGKRKKIRKVMSNKKLEDTTKAAAKAEEKRRKRIAAKQREFNVETITDENNPMNAPITTKLILEPGKEEEDDPIVQVNKKLIRKLKPHQVEAVQFMWDCLYESVKRSKKEEGAGCILAHCMGLGKTLSVISFVHTIMTHHKSMNQHTCLVVCPLNTVLNWRNEWKMWFDKRDQLEVWELASCKQNVARAELLREWQESGGIMIMGYEMYRNLTIGARIKNKKQKKAFQETLVDPGPDLCVCDEGHILKNENSSLSKAMNMMKTRRRIVLTGTPLQNNLNEYHCMVNFVKPNLLGTRKEFNNRFISPIQNGQCTDSTPRDVRIMKARAHVLHEMLAGCVQRRDYSALTKFLPPKQEYVISVRLSEVQMELYQKYLELTGQGVDGVFNNKGARLFKDYQNLMKIWTHPWVLKLAEIRDELKMKYDDDEDSFIDDDSDEERSDSTSSSDSEENIISDSGDDEVAPKGPHGKKGTKRTRAKARRQAGEDSDPEEVIAEWKTKMRDDKDSDGIKNEPVENRVSNQWWAEYVSEDDKSKVELGNKLFLLFEILRMCEEIGDKVLIFSQSILSLNIIEGFLESVDNKFQADMEKKMEENPEDESEEFGKSWTKNLDYYRMDGSTSAHHRQMWAESFNNMDNYRARLFLISTKAGGLGINLVAANRVIIFDASWNPSHDVQSIFRVYRFGQTKPCYIYRFLAQGTMEEKIYERQVTKLSLSQRVVDEHQIERHFSANDLRELYNFKPERWEEDGEHATLALPKDPLLAEILKTHRKCVVSFHEHDSLLENQVEQTLSEEEKKAAWEEYENEKKGIIVRGPGMESMRGASWPMMAAAQILSKEQIAATVHALRQQLPDLPEDVFHMHVQQALRRQVQMKQDEMRRMEMMRMQELTYLNMMQQQQEMGGMGGMGAMQSMAPWMQIQQLRAMQNHLMRGSRNYGMGGMSSSQLSNRPDEAINLDESPSK